MQNNSNDLGELSRAVRGKKSTHSTVPDLKVGVWMLIEAEALSRMPSGLILSGTCIFPTLKGRVCVPLNVSGVKSQKIVYFAFCLLRY
jgi:hypothetical protein